MRSFSALVGSHAHALTSQLSPPQLRLGPHRRGRGALTVSGVVTTPAYATVSANGKIPGMRPLPTSREDLQGGLLGTMKSRFGSTPIIPCELFLVTSWEEVSLELASDEPCPMEWLPGSGVSPSAISQGFATSKGPVKQTMQDFFVAVSDAFGALMPLTPPAWRASQGPAILHHSGAPFCLTAVFDGHGSGDHAARTAQESVLAAVASDTALLDCFARNMDQLGVGPEVLPTLTAAFRRSFAELDAKICAEGEARGLPHDGTTALVSVQVGPKLYTANAGDCRAVLCRGGRAVRLSRDHKPELPEERTRIEAAGGRVASVRGTWRVVLPLADGCTAKVCSVSRGFGDRDFKAASLISAEPDVAAVVLAPHLDAFAIHASDGLWGAVNDQEAVDLVAEVIDKFTGMTSFNTQHAAAAKAAAQDLVKLARDRGSMDDVTVVVTLYDWD
ncbi:hypothetical protein Vretimale_13899 [Volvox reticuliferus]|uniref:PPM-type phosphatase domain-containing protein n=1 Tax=Volvox reticuliferus TaxID=1737510 RepID=A0A8J4CVH9_9CHLO|nr:hypothetical protein Vretifemale_14333 [Volvox reticuliferus]GIM10129.1 hypothetical protein Vretimale_13899 [Volvox reticuliferus]